MKKFVLTVAILALGASQAFAQADVIGLYADTNGNECNITVPLGAQFSVYVLHTSTVGSTASQFQVSNPASATLLSTGATIGNAGFLAIGEPFAGVSIAYSTGCLTGTFVVYDLKFLALAAQPNCIYMTLGPEPVSGRVGVADCGFIESAITGAQAILNPDVTCDCDVSTQQSTWGKVKSLYR